MEQTTQQGGRLGFLSNILSLIFDSQSTAQMFAKTAIVIVLFFGCFVWLKWDSISQTYTNSRYEAFQQLETEKKNKKFEIAAAEQISIVHSTSGADFSAVYSLRPTNHNYFVDMVAYEGRLPEVIDPKVLGGYPVDKTSEEYVAHLNGRYFNSTSEFKFIPSKKKVTEYHFMFSCPYFSLDNYYAGSISLMWEQRPNIELSRLESLCGQSGRILGRIR
ncbi:holin lysis mediator [Serratia phage 4S]|nr:holin lysis mediator [Serratia phage 4S]